jgi:hypothetical protein
MESLSGFRAQCCVCAFTLVHRVATELVSVRSRSVHSAKPLPSLPPPTAAAQVGVCNALRGLCTCPAGWRGFNCLHPQPRLCTHKHREWGFEVPRVPADLAIGIKDDESIPWQFTRSHCAGEVDAAGGPGRAAGRAGQAGQAGAAAAGVGCPALAAAGSCRFAPVCSCSWPGLPARRACM